MSGPSKRLRVARIAPRAKAWLEESRQAFVQYSFERVVDLVNQESDLVAISCHEIGAGPFSLVMEAFLPPDLPPGTVQEELNSFGRDRGLDVFVQHENIFLATSEPSPVRIGAVRRPAPAGGPGGVSH